MNSDLILVRHARVADCYRGICYGRSDVPLGPEGLEESDRLAEILSGWPIRHLVTSGAARARAMAERIAERTGLDDDDRAGPPRTRLRRMGDAKLGFDLRGSRRRHERPDP